MVFLFQASDLSFLCSKKCQLVALINLNFNRYLETWIMKIGLKYLKANLKTWPERKHCCASLSFVAVVVDRRFPFGMHVRRQVSDLHMNRLILLVLRRNGANAIRNFVTRLRYVLAFDATMIELVRR